MHENMRISRTNPCFLPAEKKPYKNDFCLWMCIKKFFSLIASLFCGASSKSLKKDYYSSIESQNDDLTKKYIKNNFKPSGSLDIPKPVEKGEIPKVLAEAKAISDQNVNSTKKYIKNNFKLSGSLDIPKPVEKGEIPKVLAEAKALSDQKVKLLQEAREAFKKKSENILNIQQQKNDLEKQRDNLILTIKKKKLLIDEVKISLIKAHLDLNEATRLIEEAQKKGQEIPVLSLENKSKAEQERCRFENEKAKLEPEVEHYEAQLNMLPSEKQLQELYEKACLEKEETEEDFRKRFTELETKTEALIEKAKKLNVDFSYLKNNSNYKIDLNLQGLFGTIELTFQNPMFG